MKLHYESYMFVSCVYITAICGLPENYKWYPVSFSSRSLDSENNNIEEVSTDYNRNGGFYNMTPGQAQFVIGNETMSWSQPTSKRNKSRKNKYDKEDDDILQGRELNQENQKVMPDKGGKRKLNRQNKRSRDMKNNLSERNLSNERLKLSKEEIYTLRKWQDILRNWKENRGRLKKVSKKYLKSNNEHNNIKGLTERNYERNYGNAGPVTLWTVVKDEESEQPLAKNFTVLASKEIVNEVLNRDKMSVKRDKIIGKRSMHEFPKIKNTLPEREKGTEIDIYDDVSLGGNNNYESSIDDDYENSINYKHPLNHKERKEGGTNDGIKFDGNIYDEDSNNIDDSQVYDDSSYHDKKAKNARKGFTYTISINDQHFYNNGDHDRKSTDKLRDTIKNKMKKQKIKIYANKDNIIDEDYEFSGTSNEDESDYYEEDSQVKGKGMKYLRIDDNDMNTQDVSTDNDNSYADPVTNKKRPGINMFSFHNDDDNYSVISENPYGINLQSFNRATRGKRKGKKRESNDEYEDYFGDLERGDDTRNSDRDLRINRKRKKGEQGKEINNDYYYDFDEDKNYDSKTGKGNIYEINQYEDDGKNDIYYDDTSTNIVKNDDEYEDNSSVNYSENEVEESLFDDESSATNDYGATDDISDKKLRKDRSRNKAYKSGDEIVLWAFLQKKDKSKGKQSLVKKDNQKRRRSFPKYTKRRREKEKRRSSERRGFYENRRRRSSIHGTSRSEQEEMRLCLRNKYLFLRYGCNNGPCSTYNWQAAMRMRLPYFNC